VADLFKTDCLEAAHSLADALREDFPKIQFSTGDFGPGASPRYCVFIVRAEECGPISVMFVRGYVKAWARGYASGGRDVIGFLVDGDGDVEQGAVETIAMAFEGYASRPRNKG